MKKFLLSIPILCISLLSIAQSAEHKFGISGGAFIQHYNGNLGNSFFKFNTTAFGGGSLQVGMYLNPSFDMNLGASIGDFGYSVTPEDEIRNNAIAAECPTCGEALDMDQLLGRMSTLQAQIKYKLANDYILSSNAKIAPYVTAGAAVNKLSDVMGRHCVTEGYHFSFNSSIGLQYNFSPQWNAGYQLGFGVFPFKKVYGTNQELFELVADEPTILKLKKEKDIAMQNFLFVGYNF
jgi:Outer membrane protein beta-barrel domain